MTNARLQRLSLLIRIALGLLAFTFLDGAAGLVLALLLFWLPLPIMTLNFSALVWINRGQASVPALLRAMVRELLIYERVFSWQQPFRSRQESDHLPAQSGKRAVLFLHGYSCNRGLWNGWMRRLRAQGHPFTAVTMEPAFGSIDGYVATIEEAYQKLRAASSGRPPLIVAHSMGGLAARAWWRAYGLPGRELPRFITLGTPHSGTLIASLSRTENVRQMRRRNTWLAALDVPPELAARFDCYYSACDQIVCPMDTAILPGSRAINLPATGHLAMVFHPQVFADVTARLNERD